MQIDWHWQFGFLLTLPVIGSFSSKHGLDENTEDSLSGTVQAGMEGEMCQKGDMGSQLGLDGDLGFGWHLVGVQEREGKCPGTREKVEEFEEVTTGEQRTVVTQLLNHKDTVYASERFPGLQHRVTIRPELNCLEADDKNLLREIRKNYLVKPSGEKGYNSSLISEDAGESYGENGQDAFLDQFLFKGRVKNGFFVEAGADDFVHGSNSLMFERGHGWSGLLVEPHPLIFAQGLQVQRKAWSVATCLAIDTKPHLAKFASEASPGAMAGLVPQGSPVNGTIELQCLPMASLLLALDNPTVNYLSLDLEGAELEVIKTIPFNQLNIEVLSVEFNLLGRVFPGSRALLHSHLHHAGYSYIGTLGEKDDLFAQTELLEGKYKFSREKVSEDEWPEFSFWDSDLKLSTL